MTLGFFLTKGPLLEFTGPMKVLGTTEKGTLEPSEAAFAGCVCEHPHNSQTEKPRAFSHCIKAYVSTKNYELLVYMAALFM